MTNKPPPLNRDVNGDPNVQALERRGFINKKGHREHFLAYSIEFPNTLMERLHAHGLPACKFVVSLVIRGLHETSNPVEISQGTVLFLTTRWL